MIKGRTVRVSDCPQVLTPEVIIALPDGFTLHELPDGTVALWNGWAFIEFDSLETALSGLQVGVDVLNLATACPGLH